MLYKIRSVGFAGTNAIDIEVQAQVQNAMPAFHIVGLPDKIVMESKERIKAALSSVKINLNQKKVLINLAPTHVQKEGGHYDLPIALTILAAMHLITHDALNQYIVVGELSLDGTINSTNGALLAALHAKSLGLGVICARDIGPVAAWSGNKQIFAFYNLRELIDHFNGKTIINPSTPLIPTIEQKSIELGVDNIFKDQCDESPLCFSDIAGHEIAKRGLEIAAAGGHHVFLLGQPGAGKSTLARCMPTILSEMTAQEALQTTMIHSILNADTALITQRPFRTPHHSISYAAMVGGGSGRIKPGEISIAHNGFLFLDEFPEFKRDVLEALRQPLEDGTITISRVNCKAHYFAKMQLIAASNLCKCGNTANLEVTCAHFPYCVYKYLHKLSKPLTERIEIYMEIAPITLSKIIEEKQKDKTNNKYNSIHMKSRVLRARNTQCIRYNDRYLNAQAPLQYFTKNCTQQELTLAEYLNKQFDPLNSMRSFLRLLRLARTIADIDETTEIMSHHIEEANFYQTVRHKYFKNTLTSYES